MNTFPRQKLWGFINNYMKLEIKTWAGIILFEGDFSALAKCLEAAVEKRTNLRDANLRGANLSGANLCDAKNAELAIARTQILPEGDLIGWKKCLSGVIVKLKIPAAAKRSHAFGRKCRAEFAEVLEIIGTDVGFAKSSYDTKFEYRIGDIVRPTEKFDEDFQNECASGIHFYITKIEAENHS